MSRAGKFFVILVFWIFVSAGPSSALALNEILNIRHWVAPDHTRVVIDTSEDASFTVEKGERQIAIDLDATSLPTNLPRLTVLNKPGVDGIVLSSLADSGVRVEISLPGPLHTNVFKLKKFQDKPYRIVIDIILPDAAKQQSDARERIKVTRKSRVVVIDPGHGGEAPGAVGKKGTLEKNVVLAIAKKLRAILNKKEGYRAFLTRNDDYYVSFKKRLMIAREYGADLFVSIHADAARNREAGGSSVYCLSTGAASSEAAKILANYENLADVVGGVPNGEGNDASDPIILDMFQTHTINQSKTFGGILLRELGAANHLKFATVQEAPFRVLKLPEVPSILIETAYISNAKEEKLLRSGRFQKRMAEGVARAVVEFLPALPATRETVAVPQEDPKPRDPTVAMVNGGKEQPIADVGVAKGTTKRVADRKRDPISKSRATTVYRVKRGDTLSAIATRYGTTIRVLMDLNRLKRPDHLYVGRKLLLPAPERPVPSKKVVAR
ncbi:MAG: N-acetylmuramoyl-L-alanine amidase [Proteobacteria bacterium]|nr:N-acetylmuramoyl-L-alanine amidase [Pseudomonadota bacterium]